MDPTTSLSGLLFFLSLGLFAGCTPATVGGGGDSTSSQLLGVHEDSGDTCNIGNFQCAGELVCRRQSASVTQTTCLSPQFNDGYCDQDTDCAFGVCFTNKCETSAYVTVTVMSATLGPVANAFVSIDSESGVGTGGITNAQGQTGQIYVNTGDTGYSVQPPTGSTAAPVDKTSIYINGPTFTVTVPDEFIPVQN